MDSPSGPGVSPRARVLAAIRQKPHMTKIQIAQAVVPNNAYQQRVNSLCRQLLKEGQLQRHGKGGRGDPYSYTIRKRDG